MILLNSVNNSFVEKEARICKPSAHPLTPQGRTLRTGSPFGVRGVRWQSKTVVFTIIRFIRNTDKILYRNKIQPSN